MKVYESTLYLKDIEYVADLDLPWEKLQNKSIMISGATGLIGSMLIDVIMHRNHKGLNCKVYALGRSAAKMEAFDNWFDEYEVEPHGAGHFYTKYAYYDKIKFYALYEPEELSREDKQRLREQAYEAIEKI